MLGLAVLLPLGLRLLARLSGHAPARLPPLPRWQARGPLLRALPAETLRQRADMRRVEFEVVAALAGVAGAQARRQPSFAINGSLGLNAATLAGLTQGASMVSALLANVSLPLLDGGASRAQVQAEQAEQAQARQSYRAAVLAALKDVEDALTAWQGDQARASLGRPEEVARLSAGKVPSRAELDSGRASLARALADVGAAVAGVTAARAALSTDQINLSKASIHSRTTNCRPARRSA